MIYKWTDEDIQFIKDNSGKMSVREISENINKSRRSTDIMIKKMGLKCDFVIKKTEYIKNIIETYYASESWEFLFDKLGTTSKKYIKKLGWKYNIIRRIIFEKFE